MGASDRYCLRWNNHRTNLITVMDDLLNNQTLTDVTLAVEDGRFLKCHKIILAICSPYFRSLFIEVTSNHPIILLKDVRYAEVKAILEFMYKGEVSVAYDEMAALFQVAELLQVKGLVAGNELSSGNESKTSPSPTVGSTSNNRHEEMARNSESFRASFERQCTTDSPFCGAAGASSSNEDIEEAKYMMPGWPVPHVYTTEDQRSAMAALAQYHPYLAARSSLPPLSHFYDSASESASARSPGNGGNGATANRRDAPIMRSALSPDRDDQIPRLPIISRDSRGSQHRNRKSRSVNSDCNADGRGGADLSRSQRSPRENDAAMIDDEDKRTILQSFQDDEKYGASNYGTCQQKQEMKRYKKYSRKDILNAIAAVQDGLSANKAAEKYSVPSRTLYDKIKKLGLSPMKHRRSDNIGSGANLRYNVGDDLAELENVTKNQSENVDEPRDDDPASIDETTLADIPEKSIDPERGAMEVCRKNSNVYAPLDDSQPRSSNESRFKDKENEAEDLSVSRRSNDRVIVSPKNEIRETA